METETESESPLLNVYHEICKSIHDVDEFRMKLLGLLPLTSLIGIFLLGRGGSFSTQTPVATQATESAHLIGFIAIFAAALTLALFIYEIRGILRCHNLIIRGKAIEDSLRVEGQFCVCMEEHACKKKKGGNWTERASSFFDAKLAACVIYSTVMTAWIFTALHFGFGLSIHGCTFWALGIGLFIGLGAFFFVKRLIAA
jgi:hypothetical protein